MDKWVVKFRVTETIARDYEMEVDFDPGGKSPAALVDLYNYGKARLVGGPPEGYERDVRVVSWKWSGWAEEADDDQDAED